MPFRPGRWTSLEPIRKMSFDQAMAFAEAAGKRLPDESEYEFAATNGGKSSFPWGDDPKKMETWYFGPARPERDSAVDRLETDPPVFGLFSNVAEWTSSFGVPYPMPGPRYTFPDMSNLRIVRGGPSTVMQKAQKPEEWTGGARLRTAVDRSNRFPGLGLRAHAAAAPGSSRPTSIGCWIPADPHNVPRIAGKTVAPNHTLAVRPSA